ncbi:MAG TPA: SPOR domain-containing protein [Dongiaceae bacterium]|nr:SPOR domain-containing protein [Dongiaceae bacterium]
MPRTPKPARRQEPVVPPRRPIGRIVLAILVIVAVLAVKRWVPAETPEADFKPGASEASEYQAAMEVEAAEASREQKQKGTSAAGVEKKSSAVQADIAAFEEKLKQARSGEPQFGFYDSLAGSSWSVPVQRGVYITEEDRKKAGYRYMLQAASVRDLAEAQRLVQKLRGLGMEASFQAADPASSASWYRVNVGPFDNVSKMNKAEDVLVSLRMMPLKRRIP